MMHHLINRLNVKFNACRRRTRFSLLFIFCGLFLLLLFVAIRYINFDASIYSNKVPLHIGRPSAPGFKDSTKLKNR